MNTWIDFSVYAVLVVALWGGIPTWSRFAVLAVADRNPEWLVSHPEIERRFARSRWFHVSCRAWGAFSLAALLALQVGAWSQPRSGDAPVWEALKDLNSFLLIAGLLYLFGCFLMFQRWLIATVPLASRRQAPLVRRSVDDYVPRPLQLTVYGLVILHLAAWLQVGVTGRYQGAEFWGMLAFQFAISGFLLLLAMSAVRRKPSALDRIVGAGYRRAEVRMTFASQLLPLMNGAARLYEQMGHTTPDTVDRVLHLGLVAFVAGLAIAVTMRSREPASGGHTPSSRSLRSLGALVPPSL